jgi:hypothetical protein
MTCFISLSNFCSLMWLTGPNLTTAPPFLRLKLDFKRTVRRNRPTVSPLFVDLTIEVWTVVQNNLHLESWDWNPHQIECFWPFLQHLLILGNYCRYFPFSSRGKEEHDHCLESGIKNQISCIAERIKVYRWQMWSSQINLEHCWEFVTNDKRAIDWRSLTFSGESMEIELRNQIL